jgi:putative resolvase
MKSKDVLQLLNISRITLMTYVKTGKITVTKLANGYYDYHDDSVYKFLGKNNKYNVIYARVSTSKQKKDLDTQIKSIISYCEENNIHYKSIYSDVSSGIDLDRKNFSILLADVFSFKINNIYISYKDRLSRLSFKTLEDIFKHFGTNIVVINDTNKNKSNELELFEELISLIHHFSTKTYSKRRKNKLDLIKEDISTFIK